MKTEKTQATKVVFGTAQGKLVRLSYLNVFKPRMNSQNKKLEYSVQVMIPKTNVEDYKAAVAAVEEQKKAFWPNGKLPPRMHNPIKDGDKDVNQKGEPLNVPGHWVISAKCAAVDDKGVEQFPPGVVGTQRGTDGKLKPLAENEIKSGDYGRVSVNFKGYIKGDGGVGVYLSNIQKVQDGDPLGAGRKSASDEFADFADEEEDLLA